MKWHNCKTDPPKESGYYLMVFDENIEGKWYRNFEKVFFDEDGFWKIIHCTNLRYLDDIIPYAFPIKWAEIDLDEEED